MAMTEIVGLVARGPGGEFATVPLTGVKVRVEATGPFARVGVEQVFVNREKTPIEAVYVFPLEEGSAVCGFSVTIDGRRILGRVLPREEAFDTYDDAMADGHGAFLLDQERPNVFTASVGNLLPGQEATVEISYLTELAPEGDGVRLMIPTTVSPRYVPDSHRDFEGMTDAERISPPVSLTGVPYRLDLEVEADLLAAVRTVESPSHKIRAEIDGTKVRVSLAGDEGALDRDFVLTLRAEEPFRAGAALARDGEGDRYVMATFRPDLRAPGGEARGPVEAVFLVDCSGSMGGSSIGEARRALLLCLQSLSPGDRFNIVRFGSTHERLFPESVAYGDQSLTRGREFAAAMQADLGGTEILAPLAEIWNAPAQEGNPRRIVLLTDGQVSNEAEVIAEARRHRATSTVFAFGIGAGVSEHLVRGIARASGGAAEFVHPGETIEEKVLRHFERIAAASVNLAVSFEGLEVEHVMPEEVPALATGESVCFLARVVGGTEGRAVLTGEVAGEPYRAEAEVLEGPPDPVADGMLPLLWARRRIRQIEEGEAQDGRRGSRQRARTRARIEGELVSLGTRFGLVSSATSFVAVEERPEGEGALERAELRRIPVALTQGWGGIRPQAAPPAMGYVGGAPSAPRFLSRERRKSEDSIAGKLACIGDFAELSAPRAAMPEMLRYSPEPVTETGIYFRQNADGSWDLTAEIAAECDADLGKLRTAAGALGVPEAERILATLLVLALARKLPPRKRKPLEPMLEKARRWLAAATAGVPAPEGSDDWEAWAGRAGR